MSQTLYVRLKKAEGALVRLLGQIGRRGYDVLGMSVRLTPDRKAFEALIEFDPIVASPPAAPIFRPPELIVNLVSKLYEVEKAELRSGPAPKGMPEPFGNGSASESPKKPAGKATGEMHWEE